MISDSELDEEIRRVLDQGSAAPTEADELAMLRADLAKQGANMTPSMGEEMPKGTKVVFADETQAPVTPQSAAARQPIVPKVVDLTKQPMDDFEMAYAKRADMEARAREAFERGSRELVAGLTRTPVASTFEQQKDAVARLLAKRKDKDAALERTNAQRLNAAKFDYDQRSEAEKKAMEAQRRKEDLEERATDNKRSDAALEAQKEQNRLMAGIRFAQEKRDADKDARGRDLPATEVAALAELPVAEKQVDELASIFERLDMGGARGKAAQAAFNVTGQGFGTGVDEYDAAARLAMQAAGKIAEGGKLAAGDEVKYRKMMPQPGDSREVVKQKTQGMKTYLRELAQRRAQGFKGAGYNVPDELFPAPSGGAPVNPAPSARPRAQLEDGSFVQLSEDGQRWEPVK